MSFRLQLITILHIVHSVLPVMERKALIVRKEEGGEAVMDLRHAR